MKEKVCFCADRPDSGPSGGAAGVMYLLRKYLKKDYCKYRIEYLYRNGSRKDFVLELIKRSLTDKNTYYICHEPDAAAILRLLGKNYSMVYHQQGPIVQEYINHTKKKSLFKIWKKKFIEKNAFLGADNVFFPSGGASNEYFNSEYATVSREKVNIGKPLYNTINLDEEVIPLNEVRKDPNTLTFLSVGTMSDLKGQDLSFEFIDKIVKCTRKKVRWITVGNGLTKEKINMAAEKLEREVNNFQYIHYDKIPHGSVLYLDKLADVYIMLHRSSIFDLATLEAMNAGCAVVLSNIGGNKDFNVNDNCILVDSGYLDDAVQRFINCDIEFLKGLNKLVFDKYFSPTSFSERYVEMINSCVI